jgi:hypothetical protein
MSKDRAKESRDTETLVAKFLAKGGAIQKMPSGMRTDPEEIKNSWGKPRAKKVDPKKKDD